MLQADKTSGLASEEVTSIVLIDEAGSLDTVSGISEAYLAELPDGTIRALGE